MELQAGQAGPAVDRLRRTLAAHPERVEIAQELAWILATHDDPRVRDGAEAEKIAQAQVNATGGRNPRSLEALAAAKAEQGRFADAAALQARAIALVPAGAPQWVHRDMNERLNSYRQNRPVRNRF
jgi:cytochrome c-type biogenesis protein CcmH/NrfG